MSFENSNGEYANFSEPKRKLINYVDSLALFEGGSTRDVIRHGSLELWDGMVLKAEVVMLLPFPGEEADETATEEMIYGLSVIDIAGEEVESVAIFTDNGYIDTSFHVYELFQDDKGAPDYMIESFFARYGIETDISSV